MTYQHNKRLNQIIKLHFTLDQKGRLKKSEVGTLQEGDRERYVLARLILSGKSKQLSSRSLYSLGIILHHAGSVKDLATAQILANEAAAKGYPKARWLGAALFDRRCVLLGKPQRYGTQFRLDTQSGRMRLIPTDGLCSDAERRQLGLPTLPEIMESLDQHANVSV